MTIRRSGASAALLAALLLAGCAGNTGGNDSAGSLPSSPAAASSAPIDPGDQSAPADPGGKTAPVDPGTAVPGTPVDPPSGKPGGIGTQTIAGTVTAGVEPNCLVLTGPSGAYLLIINDPASRAAAKVGASVTVVGKADPRMMTTCQQGTPFVVSQVRPN
jgi:hypothetical protein